MCKYIPLILLFLCTWTTGCFPPSREEVTLVITTSVIDGWYVIAEDRTDGIQADRQGYETIITFDEHHVAKVKGHPFSGRWIRYKFLHQPTKTIIRSVDEADNNERVSKNLGCRHDGTIWFRIGMPSDQQDYKDQVIRLGEFVYNKP
jgi:hypothetical protein